MQDDDRKKKYPEEDSTDENPFLDTVNSFNSNADKIENVFQQSFIDEIGGIDSLEKCPSQNNYYIINWNGEFTISCYDKEGNLDTGHNNSDLF